MTPSSILVAAKALIPTEREWARGGDGFRRDYRRRVIVGMCSGRALNQAALGFPMYGGLDHHGRLCKAHDYMCRAAGTLAVSVWNDAPGRTISEVHAAFDLAADMALVNGE